MEVGDQLDANLKQRDRSTNTKEQTVKLVGVGAGTVVRYNKVIRSGDKKLIEDMRTGKRKVINKKF